MRYLIKCIFVLLTVILVAGCNQSKTRTLLKQAEAVMETRPDSALALLESIEEIPNKSYNPDYTNYILLMTQAKDKNVMDISNDQELLSYVADYYVNQKNAPKAALAYFYIGRIIRRKKDPENAITKYLEAKEFAEDANDYNLLGLIHSDLGVIYDSQFNTEEARKNYRISKDYFHQSGNKKNEIYILGQIGSSFLIDDPIQIDSALAYFDKTRTYAQQQNDVAKEAEILLNSAVALCEAGEYAKAKKMTLQSMGKDENQDLIFNNYQILANIFVQTNHIDSALFYARQIPSIVKSLEDPNRNYSYHNLLYNIYKAQRNYNAAIAEHEQLLEIALTMYLNKEKLSILEIQKKYEDEKLKNKLQEVTIQRQYLVLIVIIGAIAIALIIRFYRQKTTNKNKKIAQIEQNVEILNEMLYNHNEQSDKFKKLLLERLGIAKKVVQINVIPPKDKKQLMEKYGAIVEDSFQNSLDWNTLYPVINDLYTGFVDKLNKKYPNLNEKDVQLCCLIRAGFRTDEIGVIMSYKYKSVSVFKSFLREKMNFDTYEDLTRFLKSL